MRSPMLKRCVDLLGAGLGLLILALPMILIALLIRWKLGSPVLFRQQRPGLHGKPFTMYKFRTMRDAHDQEGNPLPDEQRMTRFGQFLRSASLDELPELIHVLKGEMSLVGPRPLLMEYLDRYTPEQARRHEVKPGITGWAQINGRNNLSWDERFQMDVWYVDHWNLWLDMKILFRTVAKVLKREGVQAEGSVTMPKFLGSDPP
ncbi:MAG: sugar transferase [Fimbriimonadia bacterium]|nr:sugar transferase [Fimbriimonadia bacterium]